MDSEKNLSQRKCMPCEGGVKPLDKEQSKKLLNLLTNEWQITEDNKKIFREYKLKNYYEITSLINLIVWISHQEDHHPEITFTYNSANVKYFTYAIDGLSENDFICAAKIHRLLKV